jgi:hypothetical protein
MRNVREMMLTEDGEIETRRAQQGSSLHSFGQLVKIRKGRGCIHDTIVH